LQNQADFGRAAPHIGRVFRTCSSGNEYVGISIYTLRVRRTYMDGGTIIAEPARIWRRKTFRIREINIYILIRRQKYTYIYTLNIRIIRKYIRGYFVTLCGPAYLRWTCPARIGGNGRTFPVGPVPVNNRPRNDDRSKRTAAWTTRTISARTALSLHVPRTPGN